MIWYLFLISKNIQIVEKIKKVLLVLLYAEVKPRIIEQKYLFEITIKKREKTKKTKQIKTKILFTLEEKKK